MSEDNLLAELQAYYPQMYVLKYLEIVDNHNLNYIESDFETATHLFLQAQGKEALKALILEIECIGANEDWSSFAKLILMLRGKSLDVMTLQEMGETIQGTYYAGLG